MKGLSLVILNPEKIKTAMGRIGKLGALVLFLLSTSGLTAQDVQDQVLLLNGKKLEGQITKLDESEITINFLKKNGKSQEAIVEVYRIFSYQKDGKESVLYEQDTVIGNFLTQEEMRYFILGQQDADAGYKSRAFGIGAGLIGAGVIILDSQDTDTAGAFDREPGGLFPIAYPFLSIVISRFTTVRIRLETVSDPAYLSQEYYIVGYERTARSKKVFTTLKGSVAGVLIGLGTYVVAKPK